MKGFHADPFVIAFAERHPNLGYGFESRFFCRRWMDLETHIWHPPQIFLQGRMTSQRNVAW